MDGPGDPRANAHGEFVKQIWPRIVLDGVDGVESKPVEMKLLNPIFGVLDEEVAHRPRVGSVELDRIAPGRFVSAGEETGRVEGQEIPLGTEVVVNDVQQHCDPAFVRGLDESPEVVRSSVACVRSVKKGSVIAPVPAALEVTDRHDLDGRHPKVREVVQLESSARKRALRRKSADMEFVKHHVVPFAACPGLAPAICAWVYRPRSDRSRRRAESETQDQERVGRSTERTCNARPLTGHSQRSRRSHSRCAPLRRDRNHRPPARHARLLAPKDESLSRRPRKTDRASISTRRLHSRQPEPARDRL